MKTRVCILKNKFLIWWS